MRAKGVKASETNVRKAITDLLAARGFRMERRNIMGVVPIKGGAIHLGKKGQADLYGWEIGTGRHIEVEVKKPGGRTNLSRALMQKAWLMGALKNGCIAFQTDSVNDCEKKLADFGC